MKIAALLLCAGHGSRFNSPLPKQFHSLGEKKFYRYPLDTLVASGFFTEIRIVAQKDHLVHLDSHPTCTIIAGGKSRQESVFLGLQGLAADFVVVCDGVRPFLTVQLLQEHIAALNRGEAAVNTCIPCTDTINVHEHGQITTIPNRDQYLLGQTPQSFNTKILKSAHQRATKNYTDDCSLVLDAGFFISHVRGSEQNLKITTPLDLKIAGMILQMIDHENLY
jgi:2-C-methyl-D-erythritol 4-phosphate cytidylyltransferase